MYTASFYKSTDISIWDAFIDHKHPQFFFFKRGFIEYHADRFVDASTIIWENDKPVAIIPCSQSNNNIISHAGLTFGSILISDNRHSSFYKIFETALFFWKSRGFNKFIYKKPPHFFNEKESQNDIYELWKRNASIVRRDLTTYINLSSFTYSKGRKSSISKAKRSSLLISEEIDLLPQFYELLCTVLENNHQTKPVHSLLELQTLINRFPDNIKIITAHEKTEIVAGCLIFIFGAIYHSQYLCVSEYGKSQCALDLVIDTTLQKIKSSAQYFSFGISTEQQGRYLNEGLLLQKESFGGINTCLDTYELNF